MAKKEKAPAKGQEQVLAEIAKTLKEILKVLVIKTEFETGQKLTKEG